MKTPIEIRRATINDSVKLGRIALPSFIDSHGHSASKQEIDAYVSEHINPTAFERDLAIKENLYFLMYYESKLVGYSKIILNSPNEGISSKNVTKMERLYLLKEFYGKGLAQELMNFNCERSVENKQSGMWLYVWTENYRATRFYQKMGFKISGSYDFKISNNHYNPNHLMYLSF
jgi:ribosomal protein S18 acetylase RimI-like enzyme